MEIIQVPALQLFSSETTAGRMDWVTRCKEMDASVRLNLFTWQKKYGVFLLMSSQV